MAFGLTAAGLFSDRFVGFYLAVPVAAVLLAGWRRGTAPGRRLLLWLAAAAGGGLAGLAALRAFQGRADPIGNYWATPDLGKVAERGRLLAWVLAAEVRAGNPLVVGAAAWYALAVATGVRRLDRPADGSAVGTVRLFSAVMLVGVAGAFLLSPAADDFLRPLDWPVFSRYFVGPVGAAWVGWGVWLASTARLWAVAPLAGAVAVAGAALTPPTRDRPAIDWYPERVRAVDDVCRGQGLTAGLGGYADSKPVTLLSRAGVAVRAVRPDPGSPAGVAAFPWLASVGGYDPGPGGFRFVLVADRPGRDGALPEAGVVARLGEPAGRLPAGMRTVLVYDRPEDWRLHRFAELDLGLLNRPFERGGRPVTYPGAALLAPPGVGADDTPNLCRVAVGGRTPTGVAAHGPYLPVGRPGPHRATFRVDAAGDSATVGYVDVVLSRAGDPAGEVLAAAAVPPGDAQVLPLDIWLRPEHAGGRLEFRLSFAGRGRLALRDVRFERRTHARRGGSR